MKRLLKYGYLRKRRATVPRCSVCWRRWGGRRAEALLRGWVLFDGQWRCLGCRRPLSDKSQHE